MERDSYLAIDIGASSGRHILGRIEDGKLKTEEVYRFPNGMKKNAAGTLCWDVGALFFHVKEGLKACAARGIFPKTVGIDTWGVDFVLLDENDRVIGDTVGYRDRRNDGMDKEVFSLIPEKELYARTGIQKAIFNTVYQLMAVKKAHPEQLEQAHRLLMMPEYLNFLLTGVKASEYSIASTSQLLDARTGDWDGELLDALGYPRRLFGQIRMPGSTLGGLRPEIAEEIGYDTTVVLPAMHDTGSAVLAVPSNRDDVIYISSGTWSLIGIESPAPDTSEESMLCNFTNEGGYGKRYRYLKNIMGLWMIQSMKKELEAKGEHYTFDQLCEMAKEYDSTPLRVDANDDRFLAPDSMIGEIEKACGKENMTVGELFAVVYHSLAVCYRDAVRQLERHTGKTYSAIHIVGGGSRDEFLNRLTASESGKTVYAGPKEATAIGNLLAQMLTDGRFGGVSEARACVFDSFGVTEYLPE